MGILSHRKSILVAVVVPLTAFVCRAICLMASITMLVDVAHAATAACFEVPLTQFRTQPYFPGQPMSRRPYIRNGDKTNVDGVVETTERKDMIGGRIAAYEGDPVWCPQCKKYGHIGYAGPRSPEFGDGGKRAALADDLCLCECQPYPVLIPSQTTSFSGT